MSIKVEDITKFYGKQEALSHISFEAEKGEIIGFLGPNGAGKSTMMKILTAYIAASEGKAYVAGYDVEEDAIKVKGKIGYLPEHNSLYTEMYVKEFLHFIAGMYGLKNKSERVNEMIDLVGLGIEQHKKIGELSKGYRQRVGLAAAMIHDPEVLILDEPTTGLDPNQLAEIRSLIMEIGASKTVLLSTHIMQEVEAMCSRVLLINRGKIIADKATSELKKGGQSNSMIEVEFDAEIDTAKLQSVLKESRVERDHGNHYKIYSDSSEDMRAKVFEWAVANKHSILSLKESESSLEDIFKQLTR